MFNNNLKTVLITGASGGIGRKLSVAFAKNNWNVLCHYNSSKKNIEDLERYFKDNNFNYYFIKSDFSKKEDVDIFIDRLNEFNINSIINNAGISIKDNRQHEVDLSKIIELFMINVFAAMAISKSIFDKMKNNNFGRIVNISSIGAKYGSSISSLPYACSKLALEGITKTFAREGAKYNVLVNTVRPGVMDTEFHEKVFKNLKKRISLIPLKKMIDVKEVAEIIYYLGSEKNNFITNEIITVAGGE